MSNILNNIWIAISTPNELLIRIVSIPLLFFIETPLSFYLISNIFQVNCTKKQKYLYIPEPHNDFIFSILAEELGFVGCAFVLILFGIFIWRGILIAIKAPDMFGSLIAIGITSQVAIQVILNVAVVTSSIPATGVPLPFFSYGGTALFLLLCEMGVLLNISRAGATNK